MKWIRAIAGALADKAMFLLFVWKLDREMSRARRKLRLSKVTRDRLGR